MMNGPQSQGMPIDLKNSTAIKCEAEGCDGETFRPAFMFRKVSKLLTGADKDQLVPLEVFECTKCGAIPEMFTPKGI